MTIIAKAQARAVADLRREPPILPNRTRIGSALVGAVIATALLGSVVIGLTTTDDDLMFISGGAAAGASPVQPIL